MNLRYLLIGLVFLGTLNTFGQIPDTYSENIKLAEKYQDKEYLKAAQLYSKAFAANKDLGLIQHRYRAARCWALGGVPDSAFYQLERIAKSDYYTNYDEITSESAFKLLHTDKERWAKLIGLVKAKKEKAEEKFNKPLIAILDSVYLEDQKYRKQLKEIESKFGMESAEMQALWGLIAEKDSVNLVKVTAILDKFGWLGRDVVGDEGNSTLFLVIQHSDPATQRKYLPMLRDAVKEDRAWPSSLALLEDRVAINEGRKQIYGSQIGRNLKTGAYYILPLEDPENVDKRRAEVYLPPLKEYVSNWGINWSIEQYEKDLAETEKPKKP
jgi:hypothetical protein